MHLESDSELPKRQSTKQQHTQIYCIWKQEPVKCRKQIYQHWMRGTRYTAWAQEVPSLLLCLRGEYNNKSQTTSRNLQERCSNAISENTMNSPQNTPVQSENHILTWTTSIHSRPPLKTKPQRKRNTWKCSLNADTIQTTKNTQMHDDTAITVGNLTRW